MSGEITEEIVKQASDHELLKMVRGFVEENEWMEESADTALAALEELEARTDERERMTQLEWPKATFDAAVELLGPKLNNRKSSTRKGLDRKIGFALRVWDDKYGPWNPAQAEYAGAVLASCFKEGLELPQVYTRLDIIVHHDTVHQGFLKRVGVAA